MRWLQNLSALTLCLVAAAWALFRQAPEILDRGALMAGAPSGWIGGHADAIVAAGPFIVIALGVVSLLAANVRAHARRGAAGMDIVFEPRTPRYVEHDVWRDNHNEPLPGMAYRVGIRNKTRSTLHDVMVVITVEDARPTTARFIKHRTYESDIAPRETELAELFMLSDHDIANHLKVVQKVKVRVTARDAAGTSLTFKFDNQAAIPLVPV